MSSDTISLRQQAYQFIQQRILSGEFASGSKVSEQSLAEEMGISRTPVRSAIRELEKEGLLDQVPRYGTIVRKVDRRDLAEIYELRVALEGYAAEEAADRISHEDLSLLFALCDRMKSEYVELQRAGVDQLDAATLGRFVDADMQFHMIVLRATGNRRVMKSVSESRLVGHWGHSLPHTVSQIVAFWDHHRRVMRALKRKDGDAARRAMVAHIREAKEGALRIYDRLQAEGDANELLKWASRSEA